MTNLDKYHDAMRRYRANEFGDRHMTLSEILKHAGVPRLLQDMTVHELAVLISETDDIKLKQLFAKIIDMKG